VENKTFTKLELRIFVNSKKCELIVGKNYEKYKRNWLTLLEIDENIPLTRKKWNWCAFLFAPLWFLYRKMYSLVFIIVFVMLIVVPVPIVLIFSNGYLQSFLIYGFWLALMFSFGIYGNFMYLDSCLEHARTANEKFSNSWAVAAGSGADDASTKNINHFLQEVGGTNLTGVLFYLGGVATISFIASQVVQLPIEEVLAAVVIFTIAMSMYIHIVFVEKRKIAWHDLPW